MEKVIVKEISKETKKRTYKPRKKKEIKIDEINDFNNEFVMRANEIPHYKNTKQVGYYKVGKSFHIFFEKKPNIIHRIFSKLLLGWSWKDQNL